MEVDQGIGVPGAVGGLVESHGPQAHPLTGRSDEPRRLPDVLLGEARHLGHRGGRVVREELRHRLPALGVGGDELGVDVALGVQQVQQAVQQREVGTRLDLQEQVRLGGRGGAPRIDDDHLGARRLHPLHHPEEQDGMAVGHVGADDEEQVGLIEVLVRAGRAVRPERQLVAGAGAGHAQPGVRLDLVGPHEPLGQLVRQVLRLQAHLAGDVERDRVGAVLVDDLPQPPGRLGDRHTDGLRHRLLTPLGPDQGRGQPPGRGEQVGGGGALGAELAEVGGVLLVPGRLQDRTPSVRAGADVEDQAAAHTAVRADRPHHGHASLSSVDSISTDRTKYPLRRCLPSRSSGVTPPAHLTGQCCERLRGRTEADIDLERFHFLNHSCLWG